MAFTHGLGVSVARPAAVDPQNVWLTIYTIAGGSVLVTALMGVRTVEQAGGASTMQFRHSVGNTVLCAAASIAANAVGTFYTITGAFADALQIGAAGIPMWLGMVVGLLAVGTGGRGLLMGAGTIQVTMTAAAGTGSTRYILWYLPLDTGATVVAA